MARWIRTHEALLEDSTLVTNTQIRQFTAAYNSNARGYCLL